MDQTQIDEGYKRFAISQEFVPPYNNDPNAFARGFKKFTLLQEVNTVYSDTAAYRGIK